MLKTLVKTSKKLELKLLLKSIILVSAFTSNSEAACQIIKYTLSEIGKAPWAYGKTCGIIFFSLSFIIPLMNKRKYKIMLPIALFVYNQCAKSLKAILRASFLCSSGECVIVMRHLVTNTPPLYAVIVMMLCSYAMHFFVDKLKADIHSQQNGRQ
ncbi:MAG: hypothetical protein ABF719_12500 [Acetobacter sp.]|uniref:hypothetical protein n=1 Tax=Acetobacter sp. TaxID=440 RepID=UPI0039E90B7A